MLFRPDGIVTTHPLSWEGDDLEVNVNAVDGDLRVEILDIEGHVMGGYAKEDCVPIHTDDIRYPVAWKGGAGLAALLGKIIKLRFYLTFAKLYAFQFRTKA